MFASVQKIVGYKCIAPGCDKMFDTRNSTGTGQIDPTQDPLVRISETAAS